MSTQHERAHNLKEVGPTHPKVAERHERNKAAFLSIYGNPETKSIGAALKKAGFGGTVLNEMRHADPEFSDAVTEIARRKSLNRVDQRKFAKASAVLNLKQKRRKPDFETWRREYIGRPVAEHQRDIVRAYEDKSNLRIVVLGPPGMGKDTTAGDIALYEVCDNSEVRVAWLMRSEKFSRRRLAVRLAPYLTDNKTYRNAPQGPGCTTPTRSLIDDWGPYQWQQGMVWDDGSKVEKTIWNQNEMYFVGTGAKEGDPNLWATGLGGALYGARTDFMVTSDMFDQKNQTPNQMPEQRDYVKLTMDSRLDTEGRYMHLGTRIHANDNQQWIMDWFIGDAKPVRQDGNYVQYANGTATVVIQAIQLDENGNEVSYWPEEFPLESRLTMPDGRVWESRNGTWDHVMEDPEFLADKTGGQGRTKRGLYEIRNADPDTFETSYQQNPPPAVAGEFADIVLDHCDDPTRTIGVHRPKEKLVLGVDPARSHGAGWVLWGWDRDEGTYTVIDCWEGDKLGIAGMVQKLLIEPMTRYMPSIVVYEDNRESALLHLPEVQKVFKDTAAQKVTHTTDAANRGGSVTYEGSAQVAAMVFDMRNGAIRFPAATMEDRRRMEALKRHFQNWDQKQMMRENHQGSWHRIVDDMAMAAWVGWRHIKSLETRGGRRVQRSLANVPRQVQRVFRARSPEPATVERKEPLTDLFAAYWGEN